MRPQGNVLQQMAGAYAVGSLSPRARRRFEAMLERDVLARRAWLQWEERLSALVPELPPVRPADRTWSAIEQRLVQKPKSRSRSTSWVLVAALLLAIVAVLAFVRR
jgi:anti-sigma-K factor RskA